MLKHTRVSSSLDTSRLAAAVRVPGIDPRTWVSLAIVDKVGVDDEGVIVNVTLMPSQQPQTARLGAEYAGPGYGFYIPVDVDDEVLVEAPSGDPDHGLVITKRLHSGSDPLPAEARANPTDLVLVVKEGASVRIAVAGAGKVYIGDADADEPPAFNSELATLVQTLAGVAPGIGSGDAAITALQTYVTSNPLYPKGSKKVVIK